MDDVKQEITAIGINTKGPALAHARSAGQKDADNRMANKQRKKRAHRRNLRRSNTNG